MSRILSLILQIQILILLSREFVATAAQLTLSAACSDSRFLSEELILFLDSICWGKQTKINSHQHKANIIYSL